MKKILFFAATLCLVLAAACGPKASRKATLVPAANFDVMMDTTQVGLYTLTNGKLVAQFTNYGARLVSLYVPDREGIMANVVVGRNSLKDYQTARGERYLGAITGPVAGPISGGMFKIDGVTYNTDKNAGNHTFNGGSAGVDKMPWKVLDASDSTLRMQLTLPDGQGGFPGKRVVQVTYALAGNSLAVIIRAFSSAKTPLTFTFEPWFNLHGEGEGTIEDHVLAIHSNSFLPLTAEGVPIGNIVPTDNTAFDFYSAHTIGENLSKLGEGKDFNHNWCLNFDARMPLHDACVLRDSLSGRSVRVFTNRPGLQVETGGTFDGTVPGSSGKPIVKYGAVLLAAQDWPDAVNRPSFPSVVVEPQGYFSSTIMYRFETLE